MSQVGHAQLRTNTFFSGSGGHFELSIFYRTSKEKEHKAIQFVMRLGALTNVKETQVQLMAARSMAVALSPPDSDDRAR
jgi:hypothetical protein